MFRWLKKFFNKINGNNSITVWKPKKGDIFTCRIEDSSGNYTEVTNKTEDGYIRNYYKHGITCGCSVLTNKLESITFKMENKDTWPPV